MLTLPHGCFLVCLRRNCRFCRTFYLKLFTALLCNSKKRECILWLSQLRPLNEHSGMNVKFEVWPTKWPWKLVYFPKPLAFGHRCWCSFSKPTFKKAKKIVSADASRSWWCGGIRGNPVSASSSTLRTLPLYIFHIFRWNFSMYFFDWVFSLYFFPFEAYSISSTFLS